MAVTRGDAHWVDVRVSLCPVAHELGHLTWTLERCHDSDEIELYRSDAPGRGRRCAKVEGPKNMTTETPRSIWRTWKPYVVLAILAGGAIWWWNDQSPFASPRDGVYACALVDIGSDGKYTRLTDATGTAEVRDGELRRVEAAEGKLSIEGVTMQPRGTSHFRVFEGRVGALANPVGRAIACTYVNE